MKFMQPASIGFTTCYTIPPPTRKGPNYAVKLTDDDAKFATNVILWW